MLHYTRIALVLSVVLLGAPCRAQSTTGWPSSGKDLNNSRWGWDETILNNQNVSGLVVKWQFTTQNDVSATPSVDPTGAYVMFPDWSGNLYSLNTADGSIAWQHNMTDYGLKAGMMSRTTPTLSGSTVVIGASSSLGNPAPNGAYVLALNASDGSLIWCTALDTNPNAISTASPVIYNGVVYIGVSSSEERLTSPTFRGSLVAVSLDTGQILWQTYMAPTGFSGAPIWSSSPVIDVVNSQIYITTGNNYVVPPSVQSCEQGAGNPRAILACQPADNFEDSIVALDLNTGNVKWGHHCSAEDAWISVCSRRGASCPNPPGMDYDFGSGPNLFTASIAGLPVLVVGAGQKSGSYFALDPLTGLRVWSTVVGPGSRVGGIQWGTATDGERVYAAITNADHRMYTLQPSGTAWDGGSWSAMDAATGALLWQVPDPGMSTVKPTQHAPTMGPVTVANGVVYVPSMSGYMYALDAATGATLWSYKAPGSVNGGAAVVNGTVYWGTGYHNFPINPPLGTPSNVFYAFALPPSGN